MAEPSSRYRQIRFDELPPRPRLDGLGLQFEQSIFANAEIRRTPLFSKTTSLTALFAEEPKTLSVKIYFVSKNGLPSCIGFYQHRRGITRVQADVF